MSKKLLILLSLLCCLCLLLPAAAEENVFRYEQRNQTLAAGSSVSPALIRGGDAAHGTPAYQSSAPSVAEVAADGTITALKRGSATITATLETVARRYRSTLYLQVTQPATSVTLDDKLPSLVESAKLQGRLTGEVSEFVLMLPLQKKLQLQPIVLPKNANNRKVILESSDAEVLAVKGMVITALRQGQAVLTVASAENPQVRTDYTVLVTKPVTSVSVSAPSATLHLNETLQLTAQTAPDDATFGDVQWTSSNEKVATVDDKGVVTGVARGTVRINATSADGSGITRGVSLRVQQQPTGISLAKHGDVLPVPAAMRLRAVIEPKNADNRQVQWESSDTAIATVSANGTMQAVAPGTVTITATAADAPTVQTSAQISIVQPVKKIVFDQPKAVVRAGETLRLTWSVAPENATMKQLELSSSNTSVATVDEDGTVHGHIRGIATITARAKDGGHARGTMRISVEQPVTGVHFDRDSFRAGVGEHARLNAILEPKNANNTHMSWTIADESIATISGDTNRPLVKGLKWGTTTATGTTEDGGFTATTTVHVGNYDKALRIDDLYLHNKDVRIVVRNESNMTITRFSYLVEMFDVVGEPLTANRDGSHFFYGSYKLPLGPGEITDVGKYSHRDNVTPDEDIGKVRVRILSYSTDEGYSRNIRPENQPIRTFRTPLLEEE